MKKLVIPIIMAALLLPITSSSQEECTTEACAVQEDVDNLLTDWENEGYPDWMLDLIDGLLGQLFIVVGTEHPMVLPFNAYPDGEEVAQLRLTVESQFGSDMAALVSDETLANVWAAIEEEFATEFSAAHNGLTTVSSMSYYLLSTGILSQTLDLRIIAQTKMSSYNLSTTYLTPSTSSNTNSLPVNPSYVEDYIGKTVYFVPSPSAYLILCTLNSLFNSSFLFMY